MDMQSDLAKGAPLTSKRRKEDPAELARQCEQPPREGASSVSNRLRLQLCPSVLLRNYLRDSGFTTHPSPGLYLTCWALSRDLCVSEIRGAVPFPSASHLISHKPFLIASKAFSSPISSFSCLLGLSGLLLCLIPHPPG